MVYSRLARNWMSPDCLDLLQLTSEKIAFELTEADGLLLLKEHCLDYFDVTFISIEDHLTAGPRNLSDAEQRLLDIRDLGM